jgi:glutathione S-transferase
VTPILHHYDLSPYAGKVRMAFGLKGLAWQSVQIPIVMPKPDLTELTGGYRRTPTLQLGADIYCDTRIIARTLDRRWPDPPLIPSGQEALVHAFSRWGETSFMMVVAILFGAGGFDADFVADRKKMVGGTVDLDRAPLIVAAKKLQLRQNLELLESHLTDGRRFVLGDAISLADLSACHPVMFMSHNPDLGALLERFGAVRAWIERVTAGGQGERSELSSADAIAVARDAKPEGAEPGEVVLPEGMSAGDSVVVLPEEVGSGAVTGELVPSGVHEIVVRRVSDRAGELLVHFPREEYLVVRTG